MSLYELPDIAADKLRESAPWRTAAPTGCVFGVYPAESTQQDT